MLNFKVNRPSRHRWLASILCVALTAAIAVPAFGWMDRPPVSQTQTQVKALAELPVTVMPALDNQQLLTKAVERDQDGIAKPYRIAEPIQVTLTPETSGLWETLADGSKLWRLRIKSQRAQHLNLGFKRFDLPSGAGLWIYDVHGEQINGPFTMAEHGKSGQLWTPIIRGDEIIVELHIPVTASSRLGLELSAVNHGFRLLEKQGGCNIDVICPEGDGWRDQIRSEGWFTLFGFDVCSGQMVNNTAQDGRPLFLSADHCDVDQAAADTMVVYWNYESPTCGQLSGGSLADNQSGANVLASDSETDSLLVELDQLPDPAWSVFYTGWDATGNQPQSVVGIHHPSNDEKAISFENDPPATVDVDDISSLGGPISWEVVWDQGTTEGGSSGSCIWDTATGLCVGHLYGGSASCSNLTGPDYYGKLSLSWDGSGTPSTRLKDWLDPVGNGTTRTLAGFDPNGGGGGNSCVPGPTTMCLRDGRFKVEITWTDFEGMSGPGRVVNAGTVDSGLFWFFNAANWEVLIKVLNGCPINDRIWVFAAATTNVEYVLTVTDTETDEVKVYTNPLGVSSPAITDTDAFNTCM